MIGIDLVKITRIKNLIEKFGEKSLKRFLSQSEIAICKNNIQRIAGFWATKEAISKALKVGIGRDFSFHDVEIIKAENGRPIPKFSKKIIDKFDIKDASISITHDGDYAIAVAVVENNSIQP